MSDLEVKIVRLEPMRVASAYGFGTQPETIAWEKMKAFTEKNALPLDEQYHTFGFNNPDPSPASPNYGYEIWLGVGPEVQPDSDIRIQQFAGGLYGVTRFKNLNKIGEVWKQLVRWREDSKYKTGHHQWLEELLTPADVPIEEYVFNLYIPIVE
jgi:DNA gyrase inhibitor GyrI